MEKSVILITGASSGIGRATAQAFSQSGHIVYGTSRRTCELAGVTMLSMDVRSDPDVEAVLARIMQDQGHLDILVANAGSGIAGSVEDTDLDEARGQFETNYFGALRVIRAVLPHLRAQVSGCIIGVSSVAAVLPVPFQAGYSASKAALEATLTALREEVSPFGIRVTIVEPGDTKTGFTDARVTVAGLHGESPYRERLRRSLERMEHDERHGVSPQKVAATIVRVAGKRTPPVRTTVGMDYGILLLLRRLLPDRLVQFILRKMYAS